MGQYPYGEEVVVVGVGIVVGAVIVVVVVVAVLHALSPP